MSAISVFSTRKGESYKTKLVANKTIPKFPMTNTISKIYFTNSFGKLYTKNVINH